MSVENEEFGPGRRIKHFRRINKDRRDDTRRVQIERRRKTSPLRTWSTKSSAPVLASHTLAVLSELPVTIRDPSALNDAERIGDTCSVEREKDFAGFRIPYLRGLVPASGDNP